MLYHYKHQQHQIDFTLVIFNEDIKAKLKPEILGKQPIEKIDGLELVITPKKEFLEWSVPFLSASVMGEYVTKAFAISLLPAAGVIKIVS